MRPILFAQQASSVPSAGPAPTSSAEPEGRATSFRPVEGGPQMASGEKLLVEAYAAFWLIAFVFLLLSWRRQKALDWRVGDLEAAVRDAKKAASKGD